MTAVVDSDYLSRTTPPIRRRDEVEHRPPTKQKHAFPCSVHVYIPYTYIRPCALRMCPVRCWHCQTSGEVSARKFDVIGCYCARCFRLTFRHFGGIYRWRKQLETVWKRGSEDGQRQSADVDRYTLVVTADDCRSPTSSTSSSREFVYPMRRGRPPNKLSLDNN